MQVQFLRKTQIAATAYAAGDVADLDSDIVPELIERGLAARIGAGDAAAGHAYEHAAMTGRTITASDTALAADDGLLMTYSSGSAGNIAIPSDATAGWAGNVTLSIYVAGTGLPTFTSGTGSPTIRNPNSVTAIQYGIINAIRVAADTWTVA